MILQDSKLLLNSASLEHVLPKKKRKKSYRLRKEQ